MAEAGDSGVVRTTDGGKTWTAALPDKQVRRRIPAPR